MHVVFWRLHQERLYVRGTGEKSNVYRVLVGKYERKRLFGRPRFRYDDNIKVNFEVLS